MDSFQSIPLRWVGPICFARPFMEAIEVPIATYETTLWPSIARGARISQKCGGVHVQVISHAMTRSIVVEAANAMDACMFEKQLLQEQALWEDCVRQTSRFARLTGVHSETVGSLIFLRLAFSTGDAAGHNMTTKAAEAILEFILKRHSELKYVSLSANYCTDKKVSAVNSILGRGFRVVAELNVARDICEKLLHTTPEKIEQLHIKKNLIGSVLAGSLRSANAHYANMLLGIYLATGQDAANIVEGSQGITHAQVREDGSLSFSCVLPNLIVGSIGHGKQTNSGRGLQSQKHLEQLGCLKQGLEPGKGAERLAIIASAVVLCGELSLMAALTRPGELMRAHTFFERSGYGSKNTQPQA